MTAFNSQLWQQVQEHIDNNYPPSRAGDGIDWVQAKRDAHAALDEKNGEETVSLALNAYEMCGDIVA